MMLKFSVIACMIIILFFGITFFQIGDDQNFNGYRNRMGALFFWLASINFIIANATISSFPSERGMFFREQSNKAYKPISWYFAKVLAEFPLWLLYVIFTGTVVYFVCGFSTEKSEQFSNYLWVSVVFAWYAQGMALFLGVVARNI